MMYWAMPTSMHVREHDTQGAVQTTYCQYINGSRKISSVNLDPLHAF